jgi:Tfp pilus assembly protein PilN
MHALRLDYQRSNRPFPWPGLIVLAAGLAALAAIAGLYQDTRASVARWEARHDQATRVAGMSAHKRQPLGREAQRIQALEVEHANSVLHELALPWDALFRAVESSADKNVALLALEPDLRKGTVTISAEAKNFDAMLEYARQLGQRDVFASVHLQHHLIQQADPQHPVRFSLLAVWRTGA